MLILKVESALNDQIAKEGYASNAYLAMASWCDHKGLRGIASFFYTQSEEERAHMLKLVKYVNEAGGHALMSAIKAPILQYKSIKDIFQTSFEQEKDVTKSINQLVELTFGLKDYASYNFLEWYVAEQHEEENLFRSILDLIKIGGDEGTSLLILDMEIPKLRAKKE